VGTDETGVEEGHLLRFSSEHRILPGNRVGEVTENCSRIAFNPYSVKQY
jgi:hypothetical protein